jgi:hypothetical protein
METIEISVRFEQTRLLVLAWPDAAYTHEIAMWSRNFPPANVLPVVRKDVCAARHWAVAELCKKAPADIQHFIFIDRDMRPMPEPLVPFLAADADLVGCAYDDGNLSSWAEPDAVHGGLFRVTRRLVDALPLPWWQYEYSPDGTTFRCECGSLERKVKAAGFSVARAGWCGHRDRR